MSDFHISCIFNSSRLDLHFLCYKLRANEEKIVAGKKIPPFEQGETVSRTRLRWENPPERRKREENGHMRQNSLNVWMQRRLVRLGHGQHPHLRP